MTVDKDGLSGNPAINNNQDSQDASLSNAFGGVVDALKEQENRERIANAASKAKDETIRVAGEVGTNSLNVVKNLVTGEKADFWSVVSPITGMFNVDKNKPEEPKTETKPTDTTAPADTTKPDTPKDDKKEGETPPKEKNNDWIVNLMFKFTPQGVKDWGATVAIPMVTHGQDLISKAKRPPKVVDDMGAYIDCLQGNNITVIPKPVQDYALKLLETLGLGRNEDLATALSVGFISFIRTQINNFLPSLGIKGFKDAATMAPPSPTQLLGFAHNPETFLGLFRMAPGSSHVEDGLLQVFKSEFSKKHGIENIDSFFPDSEKTTYSQFIKSYAALGQHMIAAGKWDSKNVDPKLVESADGILQKYNIRDSSGSLAYGLALASKEGADMIKNFTQPAAPAVVVENNAPKPPGA